MEPLQPLRIADIGLAPRYVLGIARSGVYRPPRPANDNDLALMQRLDELFTAWPFLALQLLF
ncbi:hypothetical protein BjapCC829_49485 (plasmid) [Bradyrhizobium barranii]|uniref:Uncharacterized protein n=1 Tax=Bradyrhizobium barranii TaxID=2992140 RepID=A0ABY3R355_9BRAD|nr:hypothetical protein [Bradyrhizobium japonicum]UFW91996.1 hypothetical protein BjapCC829_49485 [Bradyrhizobium japonicum]